MLWDTKYGACPVSWSYKLSIFSVLAIELLSDEVFGEFNDVMSLLSWWIISDGGELVTTVILVTVVSIKTNW